MQMQEDICEAMDGSEEWTIVNLPTTTHTRLDQCGCETGSVTVDLRVSESDRPPRARVSITQLCRTLGPPLTPLAVLQEADRRREQHRAEFLHRQHTGAEARAVACRTREYMPFCLPALASLSTDDSPFAEFARRHRVRERERDEGAREEFQQFGFTQSEVERLLDISFGWNAEDCHWVGQEDVMRRIECISTIRIAWWIGQMEAEMAEQAAILMISRDLRT